MNRKLGSIEKRAIEKFSIDTLNTDFRATLIAPSESGKTEYLLYLLPILVKYYQYIFLIVPCNNDKYSKFIWPNHVFLVESVTQINEAVDRILLFGSKFVNLNKRKKIIVITDDLGLHTANPSCKINSLLTRGRNLGISCFILAQSYQMISPNMRGNITHTFVFSLTDDFVHYVKNIPKTVTKEEVMQRISNLFSKFKEMKTESNDKNTRYVLVLYSKAGGDLQYNYSYIEDYDMLYQRNILHLQNSSMKNKEELFDDRIIA